MTEINGFYIHSVNLEEVTGNKNFDQVKTDLHNTEARILSLQDCQSVRGAVDFITKIHAEITLSPYLFVIIIEAHKNENDEDFFLEISRINNNVSREIIIQMFQGNKCSTFVKEKGEASNLFEIKFKNDIDYVKDTSLLEDTLKSFGIQSLLSLLYNGIGGSCNGLLLSSNVYIKKKFRGLKLIDYAVVQGKTLCLKFLSLFDWDLGEKNREGIRPLEYAAQTDQVEAMKILLEIPLGYSEGSWLRFYSERAQFLQLVNGKGNNILMIAAEAGSLTVVEFLMKFHLSLDTKNYDGKRASDLAYENSHFDVLCVLLKHDSPFPINFKRIEHEEIKKIITNREQFHNSIKNDNYDEVKKFVAENPHVNFCYDTENCSAVTNALKNQNFNICSFLKSQRFSNGIDEEFNELKNEFKEQIADANLDYFESIFSDTYEILSRCKLGFYVKNSSQAFISIKQLFDILLSIEELRPMMIFVSTFKELQIVFDMNNDINDLDPCVHKNVLGRTYSKNDLILIPFDKDDQNKVLETLAHEIFHYACYKRYENDFNPYTISDKKRMDRFDTIKKCLSEKCNELNENTIRNVFKLYSNRVQTSELIARVPEMYAKYKDKPEELQSAQKELKELFKFYNEEVKKDFDIECSKVARKNQIRLNDYKKFVPVRVRKLFKKTLSCNSFDHKSIFIKTKEVSPTVLKFYEYFLETDLNCSKIFINYQKTSEKNFVKEIRSYFPNSKESIIVIVDESNDEITQDLSEDFRSLLNKVLSVKRSKIIAISRSESFAEKFGFSFDSTIHCECIWNELSEGFLQYLLSKGFLFQKSFVTLKEILNFDDSVDEDFMASDFFSLDHLKINKSEVTELPFFISRRYEIETEGKTVQVKEEKIFETNAKIRLIADKAGMGKSTILEHYQLKLLELYPKHWISKICLRDKTECFSDESLEQMKTNFKEFLTSSFLDLKTTADKVIFMSMYRQGRVILLLDGFDEISPLYNKAVLHLIKRFMNSGENQLFITSRLHVVKDLQDLNIPIDLVKMQQFSYEDQIEFLEKYWRSRQKANIKTDLKAIAEKVHSNFVKTSFTKDLKEFIGIPLQTRMLAEIFEGSVLSKKFNFNAFKDQISLIGFYEVFIKKLFETWSSKGCLSQEDDVKIKFDSIDIMKVHESVAIMLYFGSDTCKSFGLPLIDTLNAEMIVRFGIIQSCDPKSIKFIHSTFADYFIAKFMHKTFLRENLDESIQTLLIQMLFSVATSVQHEITMIFLDSLLEKSPFSVTSFNLKARESLEILMSAELDFSLLQKPIMRNQHNVVKLICELLTRNGLMKVLQDKDIDRDGATAFQNLFKSNNESFLLNHIKFLSSVLSEPNFNKLLDEENSNGHNVLHISLENTSINSFAIAAEVFRQRFDDTKLKKVILQQDRYGNTLFHLIAQKDRNLELFKSTISSITDHISNEDLKELIKCKNNRNKNMFIISCKNLSINLINELLTFFENLFKKHEVAEIIFTVDNSGENVLISITDRFQDSHQLVSLLENIKNINTFKFKEMMLLENNRNVFQFFFRVNNTELLEDFCDFLSKILTKSELKKLLLGDFSDLGYYHFGTNKDSKVCKAFFKIIKNEFKIEDVKVFLTKTFRSEENFLHIMGKGSNEFFFSTFIKESKLIINDEDKFKMFLIHGSADNDTPLHVIVAKNEDPNVFSTFWEIIRENFSLQQQKLIITQKGSLGKNVLFRSMENENEKVSDLVFEVVKGLFDRSEIKTFLLEKDNYQIHMLHSAVTKRNLTWLKLIDFLRTEMNTMELVDELNGLDGNRNIESISDVLLFSDKDALLIILDLLRRKLDLSNFKKLILDSTHLNPFKTLRRRLINEDNIKLFLKFVENVLSNEEFLNLKISLIQESESESVITGNLTSKKHSIDDLNQYWQKLVENGQLKKDLLTKDANGCYLMHNILSKSFNEHSFGTLIQNLKNILSPNEQQEVFETRCDQGFDCLAHAVENSNFNIVKTFLKVYRNHECVSKNSVFKEKLCARYTFNRTLLHIAAKKNDARMLGTSIDTFKTYLNKFELEHLILAVDDNGDTLLNTFVSSDIFTGSNYIFGKLRKEISFEGFNSLILLKKNHEGKNFLIFLSQDNEFSLFYIMDMFKKIFDESLLANSLMHCDNFNMSALHYSVRNDDEYFIELLQSFPSLKMMLISEEENSLLLYAFDNLRSPLLENLIDFMTNNFSKDQIKNLLITLNSKIIKILETKSTESKHCIEKFLQLNDVNEEIIDGAENQRKRKMSPPRCSSHPEKNV